MTEAVAEGLIAFKADLQSIAQMEKDVMESVRKVRAEAQKEADKSTAKNLESSKAVQGALAAYKSILQQETKTLETKQKSLKVSEESATRAEKEVAEIGGSIDALIDRRDRLVEKIKAGIEEEKKAAKIINDRKQKLQQEQLVRDRLDTRLRNSMNKRRNLASKMGQEQQAAIRKNAALDDEVSRRLKANQDEHARRQQRMIDNQEVAIKKGKLLSDAEEKAAKAAKARADGEAEFLKMKEDEVKAQKEFNDRLEEGRKKSGSVSGKIREWYDGINKSEVRLKGLLGVIGLIGAGIGVWIKNLKDANEGFKKSSQTATQLANATGNRQFDGETNRRVNKVGFQVNRLRADDDQVEVTSLFRDFALQFKDDREKAISEFIKVIQSSIAVGGDTSAVSSIFLDIAKDGKAATSQLEALEEQGILVFDKLSAVTGLKTDELKKQADQGRISFEQFNKAFTRFANSDSTIKASNQIAPILTKEERDSLDFNTDLEKKLIAKGSRLFDGLQKTLSASSQKAREQAELEAVSTGVVLESDAAKDQKEFLKRRPFRLLEQGANNLLTAFTQGATRFTEGVDLATEHLTEKGREVRERNNRPFTKDQREKRREEIKENREKFRDIITGFGESFIKEAEEKKKSEDRVIDLENRKERQQRQLRDLLEKAPQQKRSEFLGVDQVQRAVQAKLDGKSLAETAKEHRAIAEKQSEIMANIEKTNRQIAAETAKQKRGYTK